MKVTHLLQYIGIFVTAVGFFHEISVRISSLLTSVRIFTFLQVSESLVFWQVSSARISSLLASVRIFTFLQVSGSLVFGQVSGIYFLKMTDRISSLLTNVRAFIFWRWVSESLVLWQVSGPSFSEDECQNIVSSDKCLDLYFLKTSVRISCLLTSVWTFTYWRWLSESLVFWHVAGSLLYYKYQNL